MEDLNILIYQLFEKAHAYGLYDADDWDYVYFILEDIYCIGLGWANGLQCI